MTLHEIRRNAEEAAIVSAQGLHRARLLKDSYHIGYWTASLEFLEDLIISLDAISEEHESTRASRARAEREAVLAAENLSRARATDSRKEIGYWTSYIDSREDLILLLDRVLVIDR